MIGFGRLGRLTLIGLPFLWLALFFLLPLLIVLKISLAQSVIGIPPYTPLVQSEDGGLRWYATLANFQLLAADSLYLRAYLGSLANEPPVRLVQSDASGLVSNGYLLFVRKEKLLAVPVEDPARERLRTATDIDPRILQELGDFFVRYN